MRKFLSLITCCAALVTFASAAQAQADVKIIVNAGNPISELSTSEVAGLFMKKIAKFPGGGLATPVEQAKSSAIRGVFSRSLLGRPASALDSYWQQQIFAGGELPPAAKPSDDEVIAFVRATPGGIGYVSAGASLTGVKAVTIK